MNDAILIAFSELTKADQQKYVNLWFSLKPTTNDYTKLVSAENLIGLFEAPKTSNGDPIAKRKDWRLQKMDNRKLLRRVEVHIEKLVINNLIHYNKSRFDGLVEITFLLLDFKNGETYE